MMVGCCLIRESRFVGRGLTVSLIHMAISRRHSKSMILMVYESLLFPIFVIEKHSFCKDLFVLLYLSQTTQIIVWDRPYSTTCASDHNYFHFNLIVELTLSFDALNNQFMWRFYRCSAIDQVLNGLHPVNRWWCLRQYHTQYTIIIFPDNLCGL